MGVLIQAARSKLKRVFIVGWGFEINGEEKNKAN